MKVLYALILIYFTCCSFLDANADQEMQAFGVLGVSILDDARYVGQSYTGVGSFGFGIGFRASSHFGFRGDINRLSVSNDRNAYPYESRVWDFGGDFIYYFANNKHQPYAFVGIRVLNYQQTSGAPSLPRTFEATVNSMGLDFGGGVQSFASPSISIRPEFRFIYDTDLDEHNDVHSFMYGFTVGVGYHW